MVDKAIVNNNFKTSKLYFQLMNRDKVPSAAVIWCSLSLPKYRFILWQASLKHLLTRDNLVKCHLQLSSCLCPICEMHQECHEHLFFQCQFAAQVRKGVASWLGRLIWPTCFQDWIRWMEGKPKTLQQKIVAAGLAASVYLIWWNRNQCVFNSFSFSVCKVVSMIQDSIKARVVSLSKANLKNNDITFLRNQKLL
ncbi:uncharacterized protein LOC133785926 [Humulus lupulus]|uniref:uncharacterized protein LOC133785926 n=1 Tax=Humulus lupulus TaxID=3486 RepID=UPI002B40A2A4|nr:uncharacterized protein LOC133785926 [Humulus lupulus]